MGFTTRLPTYAPLIVFVGIVCIASVIAGIVCSIRQLTIHVVVRNFEVVMNSMFFLISIGMASYAIKCFWHLDASIYVTAIIPASVLLIVGFIGILAACQKHETCFQIWQVAAAIGFIVSAVTASILVVVAMPPVTEDIVLTTVPSIQVASDGGTAAPMQTYFMMKIDPYIRASIFGR